MDLYGAGFNAHGQLNAIEAGNETSSSKLNEHQHETTTDVSSVCDVHAFKHMMRAKSLEIFDASWSQTALLVERRLIVLGNGVKDLGAATNDTCMQTQRGKSSNYGNLDRVESSQTPRSPVSTHDGLEAWISSDTHIERLGHAATSTKYLLNGQESRVTRLASTDAGTTAVAVIFPDLEYEDEKQPASCAILMFVSMETFFDASASQTQDDSGATPSNTVRHTRMHRLPLNTTRVASLLSTRTGFVMLIDDGSVCTWGDKRFPHALGREVNAQTPCIIPGLVDELSGLKVIKIVTGGNMAAALTEGGDAFAWGMASLGGEESGDSAKDMRALLSAKEDGEHIAQIRLPCARTGELANSEPGEDDLGSEIEDLALGDGHMLALTTDGSVFVCGNNEHGQLGLGKHYPETGESLPGVVWQQVPIFERSRLREGKRVSKVHAGDLTSFVVMTSA